jgi:hypothetical protein
MDKLIKLGVEARLHDTKISQIETKAYNLEISESEAFEQIEVELIRYNLAWGKIMREEQFMKDREFEALNIN